MRIMSLLVNAGMEAQTEDNHGKTVQYYMDHTEEIIIPQWQAKWTNIALAASPTPRSPKKSERSAIAKANVEAAKSARKKLREGRNGTHYFYLFQKRHLDKDRNKHFRIFT